MALAALRGIIALSDVFAVRDEAALDQCRKAGASRRVTMTGDLAFALDSIGDRGAPNQADAAGPVIGISIYPPALQGSEGTRVRLALQEAIIKLAASGNTIRLLAFHRSPDCALNDKTVLAGLVAELPDASRPRMDVIWLSEDTSVIASTFARLDLHVGMRYHGHVLAAIFGRPFVGMLHDNKIDEICKLFGMPAIEFARMTAARLITAIGEARGRDISAQTLANCITGARRNFTLLHDARGPRSY